MRVSVTRHDIQFLTPTHPKRIQVCMSGRVHRKRWKRKEIGVRLPDDLICAALLRQLDEPLLCGRYVSTCLTLRTYKDVRACVMYAVSHARVLTRIALPLPPH
jgi:hypothetical protein